ncbi:GGDEF domain-containing protein [Marinicella sp. S1101]|uniref:GGDEF domain-containing protein n=1 Tax=Marinicella marina TaxID=2996016 RepID=UPI0022608F71|nr:GGDEF domain-containing protein [Marinicella marina]MCX7553196.1 GGDEF domain-containing protein [Marinicella marina]MDJ1138928.1 GGDEF domain-containing protein [Marinicella marina]
MSTGSNKDTTHNGFPDYLSYQCERLIPVAKMLLSFSVAYLLCFAFLDYFKHPEYIRPVVLLRALAALPLLLLLSLMSRAKNHHKLPKYFLPLGLLSFGFFLVLNLLIPEKKYIVIIVPVFYLLVIIAMAPLLKTTDLVVTFLLGVACYYGAAVFYIPDFEYIKQVFPHMTAIVLFTLITVIKIKQYAEENYQLAKNLHWQSEHDELTGVYNRAGIFNWIKNQQLFTGKSFEPISLVMLDFDHFKNINDKYGHAVGDEVIKQGAQLLGDAMGSQSVVARFGGEEFLLILQEGSEANNLELAHGLLQQFRQLNIAPEIKVSVSMGFVNHRMRFSFEQSLKAADDCMYQAKSLGRDQLVTSQA